MDSVEKRIPNSKAAGMCNSTIVLGRTMGDAKGAFCEECSLLFPDSPIEHIPVYNQCGFVHMCM